MNKDEEKTIEYPRGLKWTKQRKRVYEILWNAKEPMNAVQIYHQLDREESSQYALSTIYRILSAFEELGFVTGTTWLGDGTVVYELKREEHTHYAVCLDCHRRIALEHCPFAHLALEKEAEDFTITSHKLELYGYCRDCKASHEA